MRGPLLALLAIASMTACGDDPDTTCDPEGSSDGESMVAGAPLGPFARAALITPAQRPLGVAFTLALDEGAGTCGEPGPGRRISVLFCDTPEANDYEVVATSVFRCPNEGVTALLEDDAGTDLAEATSGTVTVSYAGGCVAGSYELRLGTDATNETIAGSFDAVVCP